MTKKKEQKKLTENHSAVLNFLSGKGPNPVPLKKRGHPGPLEKDFMDDVEAHVLEQDNGNEARPKPTALEELMVVLRLVIDNREMLLMIEQGKYSSVSELAQAIGRELSNVSRTLSKLAAYGLVDFIKSEGQIAKKPILLVALPKGSGTDDWAEVYCIARALRGGRLISLESGKFSDAEGAVRLVLGAAAKAFEGQMNSSKKTKTSKSVPA